MLPPEAEKKLRRTPPPYWVEIMATRQRKTLVMCRKCHMDIHAGCVKQRNTNDM
jgi:hypothetical protein